MTNQYPMQPVAKDENGLHRFEENPIIGYLARVVSDLNHLGMWCAENNIDQKYQEQLAQLIGYSVSGYGSLSYVSDESYDRAAKLSEALLDDNGVTNQAWVPEVGDEVIVSYAGDEVTGFIVAIHDDQPVAAFIPKGYTHYQYEPACRTDMRPLPSDEDKAVEEMLKDAGIPDAVSTTPYMRALYKAGWCKQPEPDMSDPANW